MRVSRAAVVAFLCGAALPAGLLASCSSSPAPGGLQNPSPPDSGSAQDSGAYVPPGDASQPPPADAKSEMPLGTLDTVDEPNTPCVMAGGTKTPLFGPDAGPLGAPYATHLASLGANLLAAAEDQPGFFTLSPAGGSPTFYPSTLGPVCSFASEGSTIGGAAGGNTILYQRYDGQGNALGATVTLSPQYPLLPNGVWIGSGGGTSLAVWSTQGGLFAGGITSSGASAGPSWMLSANALGAAVAIAYDGAHFGIVWSYSPTPTTSLAFFVLASLAGPMGSPIPIASGGTAFNVQALTTTPTGFALLALGAGGDNHTYVLPLDKTGNPLPPAHRLLGADQPWSIASFGSELGVVVSGDDVGDAGESGPRPPLFRPLDAAGHALGSWVCLDTPVAKDLLQDMAIMPTTSGYSVVYEAPSGDEVFTSFDHLGQ